MGESIGNSGATKALGPTELLGAGANERVGQGRWSTAMVALAVTLVLVVAGILWVASTTGHAGGSAAAASNCEPGDVSIANGPYVGGATQEEAHSITITNTSLTACQLHGYATFVTYGPRDEELPFTFTHRATGGWPMATRVPRTFTIAPRSSAYVFFAQISCYTGYRVLGRRIAVRLPDSRYRSKVLTLATPLALCKGLAATVGNVIALSPIEPTLLATEGPIP